MAPEDDAQPTEDTAATASGTVRSADAAPALAARFTRGGLKASVRGSSHMTGGEYVLVRQGAARTTFERVGESEWLLRADAPSSEALHAGMRTVSHVLTSVGVPHRIECYDANDALTLELDHSRPA